MRTAALVATLVTVGACAGGGAADARRQRAEAERRELNEGLDRLEERLLANQARVHFWAEMRERHASVSALACTNLGRHVDSMAMLGDRQREKRDALARKNRVASRVVPAAARTR